MLVCLMLSQKSLRLSSFVFILFFCILFHSSDFHHSVLQVTYLFCLSYSTIGAFWCIFHFRHGIVRLCLFFSFSRSFKNISCIFLILAFILFLRSLIIFTIIILNSFSGRLPISSSLSCSSVVFSYSFIWDIFLCPFIFSSILWLWSVPQAARL